MAAIVNLGGPYNLPSLVSFDVFMDIWIDLIDFEPNFQIVLQCDVKKIILCEKMKSSSEYFVSIVFCKKDYMSYKLKHFA